jgi:hypothetical protein
MIDPPDKPCPVCDSPLNWRQSADGTVEYFAHWPMHCIGELKKQKELLSLAISQNNSSLGKKATLKRSKPKQQQLET